MVRTTHPAAGTPYFPCLLWDARCSRGILRRAAGTSAAFLLDLCLVAIAIWDGSSMGSVLPESRALEASFPGDAALQRVAAESILLAASARTVIAIAMVLIAALAVIMFRVPVLRPHFRSPARKVAGATAGAGGSATRRRAANEPPGDEESAFSPPAAAGPHGAGGLKIRIFGPTSRVEPVRGGLRAPDSVRSSGNGNESPSLAQEVSHDNSNSFGPRYDTAPPQEEFVDDVREEPAEVGSTASDDSPAPDGLQLTPSQLSLVARSTLALVAGTMSLLAAFCIATDVVTFLGRTPIAADGGGPSWRLLPLTDFIRSGAIDAILICVAADLPVVRPGAGIATSQQSAACLWAFDLGYIALLAFAAPVPAAVAVGIGLAVAKLLITVMVGWRPAGRVWRGDHLDRAIALKEEEDSVNTATAAGLQHWILLHEKRYQERASHTVDLTAAGVCAALTLLQVVEIASYVQSNDPRRTAESRLLVLTSRTASVVAIKALVVCLGLGLGLLHVHQYVRTATYTPPHSLAPRTMFTPPPAAQLLACTLRLQRSIAGQRLAHRQRLVLRYLAHEVRVPLNAISLALEEVGDLSQDVRRAAVPDCGGSLRIRSLATDVRKVAREARHSSGAVRQLLDDVLTMEKLNEGEFQVEPRPCQVLTVAMRTVSAFRGAASREHLGLALFLVHNNEDVLVYACGDKAALGAGDGGGEDAQSGVSHGRSVSRGGSGLTAHSEWHPSEDGARENKAAEERGGHSSGAASRGCDNASAPAAGGSGTSPSRPASGEKPSGGDSGSSPSRWHPAALFRSGSQQSMGTASSGATDTMGFALHATNGLDSPPAVGWNLMLDGNRLGQVVANFVSNALKFTPRGKAVRARVALVPLTAGEEEAWRRASPPADSPANTPSVWLGPPLPLSAITSSHPANPAAPTTRVLFRLEVEDDGSGIAPADMPRLFKPFQQIQAGEKQRGGGTGLGLSISKSIVAMHGGRVGVWSKGEGEGSTFWFDVVADRARANAPAEQERRMQGSSARPSATPPAHGAPSSSVSHPVTSGALSSESEPSSPHLRRRPSSASHMQPGVSSAEGECDDDEPDDEGEAHEAAQARCWMGGRRPAFSEAGNTAPAARPAHTVGTFPFERFHSNEQCPVEPGRAVLAPLPKGTLVSPDLPAATPTAPAPLPMPAPVSGPAPAPAPAPFPAPARPPPLPLKGHSVLVADDSKPTRALMARLLERLGADAVLEAADGQEALDMCRGRRGNRAARPLSLLLLDQNMPRLMGKEVAVEAQELGFAGAVLLLTGDEDVGEVGHALPDGVQAMLVKPVSKAALVQALEDVGVEPVAAGTSPRA